MDSNSSYCPLEPAATEPACQVLVELCRLYPLLGWPQVAEPTSAPETEPIYPTVTVKALPPDLVVLGRDPDVWIRYDLTIVQPKATFTMLLEHLILACLASISRSASSLEAGNWHLYWRSGVEFTRCLVFLRRPSSSPSSDMTRLLSCMVYPSSPFNPAVGV